MGEQSILIIHDKPDDFRAMLDTRFPDLTFVYATTPEAVPVRLEAGNPTVVFSLKHPGFPGEAHHIVVDYPSVKWVQVGGSGVDHLLPWNPDKIIVTNCAGVLARHLAETVTGAMIALNGNFLTYLGQQQQRLWQAHPFRPLSEQTLLIVGLGHIGGAVAHNAKALGMRVMATRRRQTSHPAVDELFPAEALPDIIGQADVVSLHLRLSDETRHLFDQQLLAAMKAGAVLINTARGPIVDEAALVTALQRGHLSGAYLDVFETEPLPPESPLWSLPNVLLTPHASDNIFNWTYQFAEFFADNLDRWLADQPLINKVVL